MNCRSYKEYVLTFDVIIVRIILKMIQEPEGLNLSNQNKCFEYWKTFISLMTDIKT